MAVGQVALKYGAKGAREVQRQDRNVRQSIQKTARTARKEAGSVRQWMQRHKTALLAIGAATAGLLTALIRSSPHLSAELAQVRLGFSLLAMTIGADVAPALRTVSDLALDAADAYGDLDDSIRKPLSAVITLTFIVGVLATALAALQSIIAGTVIGTLLAKAAAVAIAALTALAGVISAPVLVAVAALIAIAGVLYLAWQNNWLGIRDVTDSAMTWLEQQFQTRPQTMAAAFRAAGFALSGQWGAAIAEVRRITGIELGKTVQEIWSRRGEILDAAESIWTRIETGFGDLLSGARRWGSDLVSNFADGILSRAEAVAQRVEQLMDRVRSAMSFDQAANDRMARRWGADLVEEFSRGIGSKAGRLEGALQGGGQTPLAPAPAGAGGGGGDVVNIVVERGAVQMRGTGNRAIDDDRTAEGVADEIADRFRWK